MDISLDDQWEDFIKQEVKTGHYRSADEVVREGLRLVKARSKLNALRDMLDASIAMGGRVSEEDIDKAIAENILKLERMGIGP